MSAAHAAWHPEELGDGSPSLEGPFTLADSPASDSIHRAPVSFLYRILRKGFTRNDSRNTR